MALTFKVVFANGQEAPIEEAYLRIVDDDSISQAKDLEISALLDVYSAVKIAKEDIKITLSYPEMSNDPVCVKAYDEIAEIMAELFSDAADNSATLASAQSTNNISQEPEILTAPSPKTEPEYWN